MGFFAPQSDHSSFLSKSNHNPSLELHGRSQGQNTGGNPPGDSGAMGPGVSTASSTPTVFPVEILWNRMVRCCHYVARCCDGKFRPGSSSNRTGGPSLSCCYRRESSRSVVLNRLQRFTKSMVWKSLYVAFSLFLIFGPPVQALAADRPASNVVFEVLRNMTLIFFLIDMTVRLMRDKDYFVCNPSCGSGLGQAVMTGDRGGGGARNSSFYGTEVKDSASFLSCCDIGSFLFWCDLISTSAILYDLNYINPTLTRIKTMYIILNSEGIPVSIVWLLLPIFTEYFIVSTGSTLQPSSDRLT